MDAWQFGIKPRSLAELQEWPAVILDQVALLMSVEAKVRNESRRRDEVKAEQNAASAARQRGASGR